MKLLLFPSTEGGGNLPAEEKKQPEAKPEPPAAAATVASGKTERELELERELDVSRVEKANALSAKKKVEEDVCRLQDENATLRGFVPKPTTKEKISWMGFGG